MMKKGLLTALALLLALSLAACGSNSPQDTPAADTAPVAGEGGSASADTAADTYVFPVTSAGGYALRIDADMADVLTRLGQPNSYFGAASCAFDGLDKTYTYSGFTVTTRPEGDRDLVNSILLTDDSVTTAEGLYIGSPAQAVTEAYGAQEALGNVLSYSLGGVTLNFVLENDSVVSIEYFANDN